MKKDNSEELLAQLSELLNIAMDNAKKLDKAYDDEWVELAKITIEVKPEPMGINSRTVFDVNSEKSNISKNEAINIINTSLRKVKNELTSKYEEGDKRD